MRENYHQQLDQMSADLAQGCELAARAMESATKALLTGDLALAENVIAGDRDIDELCNGCEERAHTLLALQAPVASDLRTVLASIYAAENLERMGDLAMHVARAARRRHPGKVLPPEVESFFEEMGRLAVSLARQAETAVKSRDVKVAMRVEEADDAVDDIHRHLFTVLMDPDWGSGVAAAVDTTLLGRFYERFGDHAVSIAKRMIFAATGELPARGK